LQCLDSLVRATYTSVEILLLDNGSNDGSMEEATRRFPEITLVSLDRNHGFAGACNIGFGIAQGEYVLLLNDDAVVAPDFLEPLVECLDVDPTVAACQPKIRSLEFPGRFDYAGACGGMIDVFGFPFSRGRVFETLEVDGGQYDMRSEVFWASGACCLIRTSTARKVGLFDETFFAHMEEIDLNWRFRLAGFRVVAVPESVVFHNAGTTLHPSTAFKVYLNHRNGLAMLLKNYSLTTLLWALPVRLMMDAAALCYRVAHLDLRAIAIPRALGYVAIHLPSILKRRYIAQKRRVISDQQILERMYRGSIVWNYFVRGWKYSSMYGLNQRRDLRSPVLVSDEAI
jgi:GT2 family glycosyltransferase